MPTRIDPRIETAARVTVVNIADLRQTCWPWRAPLHGSGYGLIRVDGHRYRAHRWVYERLVGPIPPGLTLDHLCRNRQCVNPAHLEPVTVAANVMRGESPAARNARKTHCAQGHAYTEENTYRPPSAPTRRMCVACDRAAVRRRRSVNA